MIFTNGMSPCPLTHTHKHEYRERGGGGGGWRGHTHTQIMYTRTPMCVLKVPTSPCVSGVQVCRVISANFSLDFTGVAPSQWVPSRR